jgi:hypothetical protein
VDQNASIDANLRGLKHSGEGDTLVVTRLDRLGRSLRDLANVAHEIDEAGANLKVIEQGVDTSTATGRAFFGMLAVFAAYETDVRRERQLEGIAMAKRRGVYTGRKQTLDRVGGHVCCTLSVNNPSCWERSRSAARLSPMRTEISLSPVLLIADCLLGADDRRRLRPRQLGARASPLRRGTRSTLGSPVIGSTMGWPSLPMRGLRSTPHS